jgi:pyruvate/2-oxoglutarate/acetoin dehydrogenase E1 component
VTRADVPISFAVELELAALPSRDRLVAAVRDVVREEARR